MEIDPGIAGFLDSLRQTHNSPLNWSSKAEVKSFSGSDVLEPIGWKKLPELEKVEKCHEPWSFLLERTRASSLTLMLRGAFGRRWEIDKPWLVPTSPSVDLRDLLWVAGISKDLGLGQNIFFFASQNVVVFFLWFPKSQVLHSKCVYTRGGDTNGAYNRYHWRWRHRFGVVYFMLGSKSFLFDEVS